MAPLVGMLVSALLPIFVKKVEERVIMTAEEKKEVVVSSLAGIPKSKSMWLAFLLAIFGVIETYQGLFTSLIGDKYAGTFLLVLSGIMALLRATTDSHLMDK